MVAQQHLSAAELEFLLFEEGDPSTSDASQHLSDCELCRDALETLSAQTDFWSRAPDMLRAVDAEIGLSSSMQLPSHAASARSHSTFNAGQASTMRNSPTYAFSETTEAFEDVSNVDSLVFEHLLDPPQHPEMLGRVGPYDIERVVGSGGMGIVFKAHDHELNRPLAIKVLASHLSGNGTARKRFANEARAAAGVLHPNVIAVHGVNNEGKTPYIVMPFVAGPSLQELVDRDGPLPELEIVRIAKQIASGLAAAHSQGLVHRDIKPANILVESEINRVLITDFGLARCEDDAALTRTGWLTGTPNYMSPEQACGERPDQRSDLFSLGSLMYFLATGHLPFRADGPLAVLGRIQNDQPTPVQSANPSISKTLADIIQLLHQKKPENRIQTAAELDHLLEEYLVHLHQPDQSKPPKIPSTRSRMNRLGIGGAIFGCALLAGMAGLGDKLPNRFSASKTALLETQDFASASNPSQSNAPNLDQKRYRLLINRIEELVSRNAYTELDGLVSELEKRFPNEDGSQFYRGYLLHTGGKHEEAMPYYELTQHSTAYRPIALYNLACLYSLRGEKEKAFDYLHKAIESGLPSSIGVSHLCNDDDLQSIREEPQFKVVIEKFESQIKCIKEEPSLPSEIKAVFQLTPPEESGMKDSEEASWKPLETLGDSLRSLDMTCDAAAETSICDKPTQATGKVSRAILCDQVSVTLRRVSTKDGANSIQWKQSVSQTNPITATQSCGVSG